MEENIKVYNLGGKKITDIKSDITGSRYLRIENILSRNNITVSDNIKKQKAK